MSASDSHEQLYRSYVSSQIFQSWPQSIRDLGPRGHYLKRMIRRHFPADRQAHILDLGCGHGALVHFLHQAGYENVLAVDASPEQVDLAKRLGIPGIRQGDLGETLRGLPSGSQDVVVAFDVLEHHTKPDILKFTGQARRVLKPGGCFILHTPNGESPFGGTSRYHDFTHETAFTRNSLTQILLMSGFSSSRSYEDAPIPHGIISLIRFFLWMAVRGILHLYTAIETGAWDRKAIYTRDFLTVAYR
jgi:2-polyprenyl-3-methyl-5-hydroxy-6-metoxy-1,4-benzoquinol methylase